MTDRLFISQQKLEGWIEEAKVTFQDNVLKLLAENVSYRVEPAVRVLKLLDGHDGAGLLGKTMTVAELTAQKAEHYSGGLILGETAYECEDGFMGTSMSPPPATVETPAPAPVAVAEPSPAESPADNSADLLAEFMLKHL